MVKDMNKQRFINMGSIGKFSAVVKNLCYQVDYDGKDEEGNAKYSYKERPVLKAIATEKIHGTNMAVCYNADSGFYVQSRKNIITPLQDNNGCAFVAESKKDVWMHIINALAVEYNVNLDTHILTIYSEWCGGNIQRNSCVSGLDKRAIMFQYFKVSPLVQDEENPEAAIWLETRTTQGSMGKVWEGNADENIFNVMDFEYHVIEVDFNKPEVAQNSMIKLLKQNELNSPTAKAFGIDKNILEGYVYTTMFEGQRYVWKVKGEEHSKSSGKVKTLKVIDEKEEQLKSHVAQKVVPGWRLMQMYQEIINSTYNGDEKLLSMKDIGIMLKLVNQDIVKEELDVLTESGFEFKHISSYTSKIIKAWFIDKINNNF